MYTILGHDPPQGGQLVRHWFVVSARHATAGVHDPGQAAPDTEYLFFQQAAQVHCVGQQAVSMTLLSDIGAVVTVTATRMKQISRLWRHNDSGTVGNSLKDWHCELQKVTKNLT
jgi:hypothetical protein